MPAEPAIDSPAFEVDSSTADVDAREPWSWPERLCLVPLALLLLLLPLLRSLSDVLVRANGERLLVVSLELAFVFLTLAVPRLQLPRLRLSARSSSLEDRLEAHLGQALTFWLVWSLAASFASEHVEAAIVRQAEWLTHLLFAVALVSLLRLRPRIAFWISLWIPAGLVLYALALPLFALGLEDPASHRWTTRLPGFGNIRHFAYHLETAALFCAPWFAWLSLRSRPGAARAAFFFAAWVAIFWGGNRGAFIACLGTLALLLGLGGLPRPARFAALASGLILGAALVSAPIPTLSPSMGVGRFVNVNPFASYLRPSGDEQHADPSDSNEPGAREAGGGPAAEPAAPVHSVRGDYTINREAQRAADLRIAAAGIGDALLLGLGPDGFGFLYSADTQPHNWLAQSMVDWGVPGSVAMTAVLLLAAALAWERLARPESRATRVIRVGALGAFLGTGIHSAIDGTLYFASPTMFAAASIAIALVPAEPVHAPEQRSARGPRLAAAGLALGLAMILGLNAAVSLAVSREAAPGPGSFEDRLIHAFPHRVEALNAPRGTFDWARAMAARDPASAIDWLHLGHRKSRRPWAHAHLEAHLLFLQGREREAREHLALAEALSEDFDQLLETRALARSRGVETR